MNGFRYSRQVSLFVLCGSWLGGGSTAGSSHWRIGKTGEGKRGSNMIIKDHWLCGTAHSSFDPGHRRGRTATGVSVPSAMFGE